MREAVIGYSAMYALGGVLGIALLRNVPPTVGKPIVESWRAPDSGHKPRAD